MNDNGSLATKLEGALAPGARPPRLAMFAGDTLIYRVAAGVCVAALPAVTLADWLTRGAINWVRIATLLVILGISLACIVLARRGMWDTAGAMLLGTIWLCTTFYCLHSGYGMHSAMVLLYLPCLLYAMLFFGSAFAIIVYLLTLAALGGLYAAEETGRIGGMHAFLATGGNFNYLVGAIAACTGTLVGGLAYQRRVLAEAGRLAADAQANRAAADALREAHAAREQAASRLAGTNAELSARATARAREADELRRVSDAIQRTLSDDFEAAVRRLHDLTATAADPEVAAALARLDALCTALRELGEVGRHALRRENLDLGALAREAAARAWSPSLQQRARLEIESRLEAHGDPLLLQALLEHLLSAAMRADDPEPEPVLRLGRGSQDGRMFYYLHRQSDAEDRRQRSVSHTPERRARKEAEALWLAIARRIAERHGGDLDVASTESRSFLVRFTLDGAADPAPPARQ